MGESYNARVIPQGHNLLNTLRLTNSDQLFHFRYYSLLLAATATRLRQAPIPVLSFMLKKQPSLKTVALYTISIPTYS